MGGDDIRERKRFADQSDERACLERARDGIQRRATFDGVELIHIDEFQGDGAAKASFEVGACLGIPAMTAYHAIAVAGAVPGVTLLIAGGAGAVGHYAVQFAKAAGATVIATVSSPGKADAARAAGADYTIDYRREDVGASR